MYSAEKSAGIPAEFGAIAESVGNIFYFKKS